MPERKAPGKPLESDGLPAPSLSGIEGEPEKWGELEDCPSSALWVNPNTVNLTSQVTLRNMFEALEIEGEVSEEAQEGLSNICQGLGSRLRFHTASAKKDRMVIAV